MTEENSSNQKVTNVRLQENLKTIEKKLDVLPDIVDKLHDIDKKTAVVCVQVQTNKDEIDGLRKRGNLYDIGLAAFTAIGITVSSILGTKQ